VFARSAIGKIPYKTAGASPCPTMLSFLPIIKFQHLIHRWRGPPSPQGEGIVGVQITITKIRAKNPSKPQEFRKNILNILSK
jgi:hypothetical protein